MSLNESGQPDQLRNLEARAREAKVMLRQRIHNKMHMCIMSNPINTLPANIDTLTEWILNLLASEGLPPPFGPIPIPEKMLGLTPKQIMTLKHFYEDQTGRKAEEL